MLEATDCARFTGYRPCDPGKTCDGCADRRPVTHTSLLVNLDNLGNVIQTTALLPALRRAFPDTFLTWVTAPSAAPVLENNPLVDRVMPYGFETVSILGAMEFDLVINLDKTMRSAALAGAARAADKRGFGLTRAGAIEPFGPEAEYAYRLGLDDELKFRTNTMPGTQIACEAVGLEWRRDPYVLELTDEEKDFVDRFREGVKPAAAPGALAPDGSPAVTAAAPLVGINTGSSPQFPNKSMSVDRHVELVRKLAEAVPAAALALLGGRHETDKNAQIASRSPVPLVQTPTTEGVRRGLLYVDACDIVVSGDTSGLHMAVALGKWAVAYFTVTCAAEIDLYDRGVIVASDLPCSPCWRPACPAGTSGSARAGLVRPDPKCIAELDLGALVEGVRKGAAEVAGASGRPE